MWSETAKRFLVKGGGSSFAVLTGAQNWYTSRWLEESDGLGTGDNDFKFQHPYRMIHMGTRNSYRTIYAIVFDPDFNGGKYRMLQMEITNKAADAINKTAWTLPDRVNDAKFFVTHTSFVYLYYVTHDNRVWSYNLTTGEEREHTSEVVTAGHEIVQFRTLATERPFGIADLDGRIYVVTKDPSQPEESCCTLTAYVRRDTDVPNLRIADHTVTMQIEGSEQDESVNIPLTFSGIGNVVSFTWKEK